MEYIEAIITCIGILIASVISVLTYCQSNKHKKCPFCGKNTIVVRKRTVAETISGVSEDNISYCSNTNCVNSYQNKYSLKIFGDD